MANIYKDSGVNIELGDKFVGKIQALLTATYNKNVIQGVGGFASLYQINSKQILAASTDGVGTKVKIACALNQHKYIGQDLVAMCVNDLICTGAKPLFFLDYFATGKLDLKVSTAVLSSLSKACQKIAVALIGGETAEMPGVYPDGIYDLAGFSVGIVDKKKILDGRHLKEGDRLIGLRSSGAHSNGYSLLRKLFSMSEERWMKRALKPTRLYVNSVLSIREKYGSALKGAAHITGSGFLNIPRMNEKFDYVIERKPMLPSILAEAVKRGGLDDYNAYTTFNMGVGFVMAVDPKFETKIINELEGLGEVAFSMGYVIKGQGLVMLQFSKAGCILA